MVAPHCMRAGCSTKEMKRLAPANRPEKRRDRDSEMARGDGMAAMLSTLGPADKRREIPLSATRRTKGVRRTMPGRCVRNEGWDGFMSELKLRLPKESVLW